MTLSFSPKRLNLRHGFWVLGIKSLGVVGFESTPYPAAKRALRHAWLATDPGWLCMLSLGQTLFPAGARWLPVPPSWCVKVFLAVLAEARSPLRATQGRL